MSSSGQFSLVGLDDTASIPDGFEKVVEGFAAVLFPPAATKKSEVAAHKDDDGDGDQGSGQSIFYNPAQVVNRDLSICAIEAFSRLRTTEPARKGGTGTAGITILEALSATGLRALRYWKEISGVKYIIANDLDKDAVECIRRNCAYNDVPVVVPSLRQNITDEAVQHGGGVICNHDDAIHLMQRLATVGGPHAPARVALLPLAATDPGAEDASPQPLLQQELMDVVDLDPYGTASPFLDAAFAAIKEGGLMLVTSTDSPILCGNYPDTCHAKYNSLMMKPDACHEVAVRILLAAAERAANKHKKYIVPLISLHIDFYVRVFFRVYTQAAEAKLATAKLAHVAHCTRCPAFWITPIGRVKLTRKEVKKRRRTEGDAGSNNVVDEVQTVPTTDSRSDVEPPAVYPSVPARSEPFKVSCPTIETWLPQGTNNHCPCCGGHISIGGPIYAAPTQDREFLDTLLKVVNERAAEDKITATDRVRGLILAAKDELPEAPLFYSLPEVSSFVKVRCPPTPQIVGALSRLGYRFSQVHCHRSGIKTTCPPTVLMRALLAYKETDDGNDGGAKEISTMSVERAAKKKEAQQHQAHCLLSPLQGLDFSYDRAYDFRSQATGVAKFIPNAPGWGPKRRHQGVADQ